MCGCGCGTNDCDGALANLTRGLNFGLGNLARLGALLKAGTPISQGFQLGLFTSAIDLDDLEGCLYSTGAFSSVTVSMKGYVDVYLQVDGVPSIDFGSPEDLSSIITSTVQGCIGRQIKSAYPIATGQPPPEFRNDPNVTQSNYQQFFGIPGATPGQPAPPGKCDKQKGLDYVACSLGLKPTDGVYVGALGAVAAFLLFAVVLKR